MSERLNDPEVRSVITVEDHADATPPPEPRLSRAGLVGWVLLTLLLTTVLLLWAAGYLRVSGPFASGRSGRYEARTMLHVHPEQPYLIFKDAHREDPNFNRTQLALIKSRLVLATALKSPQVAALKSVREQVEPIEWLAKQIQADFSEGPDFLVISMRGNDPEELTVLVNAVTEAYLNEVVSKEHSKLLARIDQLKELAQACQNRVDNKKTILRDMRRAAQASGDQAVELQNEIALKQRGQAEKELLELRSQVRVQKVELSVLLARDKTLSTLPIPSELIDEALTQDVGMADRLKAIAALEEEVRMAKERSTIGTVPRDLSDRLKAARQGLEARRLEMLPRMTEQVRGRLLRESRARIAELETNLAIAEQLEKDLVADLQRYLRMMRELGDQSSHNGALHEEIQHAEEIARKALNEAAQLDVERTSPPRVQRQGEAGQVEVRRVK